MRNKIDAPPPPSSSEKTVLKPSNLSRMHCTITISERGEGEPGTEPPTVQNTLSDSPYNISRLKAKTRKSRARMPSYGPYILATIPPGNSLKTTGFRLQLHHLSSDQQIFRISCPSSLSSGLLCVYGFLPVVVVAERSLRQHSSSQNPHNQRNAHMISLKAPPYIVRSTEFFR